MMKVILTGSTGFVGHEVLSQCLAHPAITSIVALSRRDLPAHKKLKVALIEDFMIYQESIRDDIRDAEACIWTLGKARMSDNDIARRVSLDYTLAAAQVFQETCQKPFRFIYCSGAAAERDQTKPLWFMQEYRRIRGQVENALLGFDNDHPGFETHIMRPAMVLAQDMSLRSLAFSLGPSVTVNDLAGAMLDLALKGGKKNIWENADLNLVR
ncbi:NAD(P)-binding domain [Penicillium camemberti]|uniref:NAD(P)-binding domain n=1 Tax=Penicillium camemberti (strain FM 013) TaxID=1429867 RepID=A0A0G4P874_PENC3|nr:NAD(P)-binding domain [Penicillium camemberti]